MNRDRIKQIAVQMVKEQGLINLSRQDLCDRAGLADGSFSYVMGCNFSDLVEELRAEAIPEPNVKINKSRVAPKERQQAILKAAIELAKTTGYKNVTRNQIAEEAGVSMGLVTKYLGTMQQLRKTILKNSIRREVLPVIAQALVIKDPLVKKIPDELKNKALASL